MSSEMTELARRKCAPCKAGTAPLSRTQALELLRALPGWRLEISGQRLRREWAMKDFAAAVALIDRMKEVAEAEDHHPDIHLTGYRNLAVELSTHSIRGLSDNDFILAAKIEQLPKDLKKA